MASWRDSIEPIWLCLQDLVDATSSATVIACLDDTNSGVPDASGVRTVISRAEGQVLSYLVSEHGPAPLTPAQIAEMKLDPLLGSAALEFAIAYMFDKAPEYVRASRQEDVAKRLSHAEAQMMRILQARQRPPTVVEPPANVGGFFVDNAKRLVTDDPGGPAGGNAGDY